MDALELLARRPRLILFACVAAVAIGAQALADTHDSGGTGPGQTQNRPFKGRGMTFYVAKGATDACGRGCNEWIAADGVIDRGSADRLRALLAQLSGRKLPIYFHSRGGLVNESIAIGRLLRSHRLTAGVALTIPDGCPTAKNADQKHCDTLKHAGRPLPARFKTSRAYCLSACVYALVGAPVRDIAPNAALGVHATRVTLLRPPEREDDVRAAIERANKFARDRLLTYLAEIGVPAELYWIASRVGHNSMHVLTRNELARLKIANLPALAKSTQLDSARVTELEGLMSPLSEMTYPGEVNAKHRYDRRTPEMRGSGIGGVRN